MASKLSFDRGQPLAYVIDNKSNKILHTVKTYESYGDEPPDIAVDDPIEVLDKADLAYVAKKKRLNNVERSMLRKALKSKNKDRLNSKLQQAYDYTLELLEDKLNTELDFTGEDVRVIPVIGHNDVPYDRHIFLVGASNSGKSYLAADILRHDVRSRPIMLISKLSKDPAFADMLDPEYMDPENFNLFDRSKRESIVELEEDDSKGGGLEDDDSKKTKKTSKKAEKKIKNDNRMKQFPVTKGEHAFMLPSKDALKSEKGAVILFDDIATFDPELYMELLKYQNDMLETARKHNISVISTSHALKRRGGDTKTNINEAEFVVLFPKSNRLLADSFLRDDLGLRKGDRDRILDKSSRGRYMCIKTSQPVYAIHEKGIIQCF